MDTPSTPPPLGQAPAIQPSLFPATPAASEPKYSGVGIASFVLSIVVAISMFGLFVVAGVLHSRAEGGRYPAQGIVGAVALLLMAGDVAAAALGIGSLFQSGRKKLFGVLGLVFAALTLIGTIGLMFIGLMFAHRLR